MLNSKRFETLREYPGTSALAALWVLVYAVMVVAQWQGWSPYPQTDQFSEVGPLGIGAISQKTGQIFGAWNSAEILCGQIWRTILATFVHFGLIHITLNMFGLIQLGQLIEEWYGPRLLFGIVILIGFLGNGLAALARPLFGPTNAQVLMITSGGGSTVVFGLIGLIAVVGLRSRSRMGKYLYNQMIGLLAFNFVIGLTIPQIDNYAHAGGAIAGALIGRFHYTLLGWHESKPIYARITLGLSIVAIAASIYGQVWIYKIDSKATALAQRMEQVDQIRGSLSEVQSRYITRSVLGLKAFQIIQLKGKIRLPWDNVLLINVGDKLIMENQKSLVSSIDKADKLVQQFGSENLTQSWKILKADLRIAISRPPLNSEIRPFQTELEGVIAALLNEAKSIRDQEFEQARKLILWKTPWPNVIWTDIGPAMKNGQPRPVQPNPDSRNRPALLP